jgi:hypothetical protein
MPNRTIYWKKITVHHWQCSYFRTGALIFVVYDKSTLSVSQTTNTDNVDLTQTTNTDNVDRTQTTNTDRVDLTQTTNTDNVDLTVVCVRSTLSVFVVCVRSTFSVFVVCAKSTLSVFVVCVRSTLSVVWTINCYDVYNLVLPKLNILLFYKLKCQRSGNKNIQDNSTN